MVRGGDAHAVFDVPTEALIAAIPSAVITSVDEPGE